MPPNNPMSLWGNEKTMNLNPLVLTNIQSSPYFKVKLFELKTYHEVIDEIYYKVSHLEPWEKGSRKTAGQTGMCGGVRGVGAGGIVSSAYCLLYKLFTLKLTKKQVIGLINHPDSPFIRGLGFMYIRYTQPPADLWAWFEDYLDDDEEIDVKAGGGHIMTIGEMLRQWLVKLEWYSTLFPRIPVPIQKDIAMKLKGRPVIFPQATADQDLDAQQAADQNHHQAFGDGDRRRGYQDSSYHRDGQRDDNYRNEGYNSKVDSRENSYRNGEYSRDKEGYIAASRDRDGYHSASRDKDGFHSASRDKDGFHSASRDKDGYFNASQDRDGNRNASWDREHRGRSPASQRYQQSSPFERASLSRRSPPRYANSFERELARERERQQRELARDRHRSRSRSPRDQKESESNSRDHKEKKSPSRKDRRSRSRDRKEKRSRSRDRKEKMFVSRDRKERRSGSRDRKEIRPKSEHKEKRRSRSTEKDLERHSSSHKHSHKDKRHRDEFKREGKSKKHKHKDREH